MNKKVQLPKDEKGTFVITKGLNQEVVIFSEQNWKQFNETVLSHMSPTNRNTRHFSRIFLGSAIVSEVNADGEVYIPEALWEYLTMDKEGEAVKIYSVEEYLAARKENIRKIEKDILGYVSFVIVGQE